MCDLGYSGAHCAIGSLEGTARGGSDTLFWDGISPPRDGQEQAQGAGGLASGSQAQSDQGQAQAALDALAQGGNESFSSHSWSGKTPTQQQQQSLQPQQQHQEEHHQQQQQVAPSALDAQGVMAPVTQGEETITSNSQQVAATDLTQQQTSLPPAAQAQAQTQAQAQAPAWQQRGASKKHLAGSASALLPHSGDEFVAEGSQ